MWDVYSAYADAPEQFRNFSQEILSLHIVFKRVEDQLCNQGPGNNILRLSAKDMDDLKILHDGLQTIMKELDACLKKYQSLTEDHSISFDRLRWGQEDLVGFRERILMHVGLLTAFNTSLMCGHVANQNASLVQHTAQLVAIQEQLGQIFAGAGLRSRGSVASLSSVASFALGLTQRQKAAWKELCTEFHCNGITPEMIKAKKKDIIKLFRTATVMSSNDDTLQADQGTLSGNDADAETVKKDSAPLSDMLRTLSLSAARAQYYVAALGSSSKSTTLHVTAERGHLQMVELLLSKGARIDARDHSNQTALHIAAQHGHTKIVSALLEKGASIDARDHSNQTALHISAQLGYTEIVNVLLGKGASIDATDDDGRTALHPAAEYGHTKVASVLLERGASIDARMYLNQTALHRAAQYGSTKVVNALLEKGASIDARTYSNQTVLHLAALHGHSEAVNILLEKGASIDATDDKSRTALHLAALRGHTEVAKALLEKGVSIDATDRLNWTALHTAVQYGHTEVANALLEQGASIDATDYFSRTVLHTAAEYGYTEVVKVLLSKGANIELRTSAGETALKIAQRAGMESVVKLLAVRDKRAMIALVRHRAERFAGDPDHFDLCR